MRVGAVAFKLAHARSDGDFFGHMYDFVESAHQNGVQLLVFPEFAILELVHLFPDIEEIDVPKYLAQYAQQYEDWLVRMSQNSGIALVGGSHFTNGQLGFKNSCFSVWPDGTRGTVVKNKLTQYESQVWNLRPGNGLIKMPDAEIGNLICYDSEFPEAARVLCESGVKILNVPAFTETRHGFQRVRWCAHARAIENQVFVIHASLLGDLGREPVPATYGSSAVICPSITPFPQSGMLAETPLNEEGIAIADLDMSLLDKAREEGDVRNWFDRSAENWRLLD